MTSKRQTGDLFRRYENNGFQKFVVTYCLSSWLRQGSLCGDVFWNWISNASQHYKLYIDTSLLKSSPQFSSLQDVIIKTILVAMPHLFHAYHMCRGGDAKGSSCCFEVLGFDVFIDRKYKPWVIEVSFGVNCDFLF